MNDTSAQSVSGASLLPSDINTLTTVHFVILALVAAAIIAMIVAGIRRRRTQDVATREVIQHAEEAGVIDTEDAFGAAPKIPPDRVLHDEPIAAAAPLDANPATRPADTPIQAPAVLAVPATPPEPTIVAPPALRPISAQDGPTAPVTQLKGLGPKVAARLGELGITTIGQLASLNDDQTATLDADLGPFRGRLARDRWIEQARLLTAGDRAGFETVFGRL